MRTKHVAIAAMAAAGALVASPASPALATTTDVSESTSANWSGYVVGGSSSGGSQQYSSVAGSWVEPAADCSSGDGDAAFWVGLGGASSQSGALEQVGTQVDCSSGSSTHHAWYELVPAGPVQLDVAINAGDHVSARVAVSGSTVTVSLTNQTTGGTATKTLQMDNPDVSSAEWIAEAPSVCQGDAGNTASCTPVSLANFGTVTFTGASATANGSTGTISSSNWTTQAVQLNGTAGAGTTDPALLESNASGGGAASATPSSLSSDGSSFSVTWQSDGSQSVSSSSYPGDPGSGYAPPSDGYGPPGGYAPGDGYGYSYGDGGGYFYGAVGY